MLVDTQGWLLDVRVTAASVREREGAYSLLTPLTGCFPRVQVLRVDQGFDGLPFEVWVQKHLGWRVEVARHPWTQAQAAQRENDPDAPAPPRPKGFQILPNRWVVERSFAWISRARRLARDYEGLPMYSEAFIQVAMIRLMLSRLVHSFP